MKTPSSRFDLNTSLGNQLPIFLVLLSGPYLFAQGPILGEQPQTVADVYLPKVEGVEVETWVDNLRISWTLLFLPNGDALVSERPGRIRTRYLSRDQCSP